MLSLAGSGNVRWHLFTEVISRITTIYLKCIPLCTNGRTNIDVFGL